MRRLLILCEFPTLLGGERSMLATLPAVQEAGFEVLIACPPQGELAQAATKNGAEVVPWQVQGENQRRPLTELRHDLVGILGRTEPDLLHANSLSMARVSGPVAREQGTRSLGHLRDIIKLSGQAAADLGTHCGLAAVSQATRQFHEAQGVSPNQWFVVHNGVDLTRFAPCEPNGYLHQELGLPAEARLIATIGQLGLRKGTDEAIQAIRQVVTDDDLVHWLVVGERTSGKRESREFEQLLRDSADKPPLAGRVHFLGSRSDVPQLMNECTLLLHAARQEPLGRVLLEAAASGLPVVATDVGGTREIYPAEQAGALLVPADDVSAMADCMSRILGDRALRQQLALGARQRAEQAFDIRQNVPRLIAVYEQLLA